MRLSCGLQTRQTLTRGRVGNTVRGMLWAKEATLSAISCL